MISIQSVLCTSRTIFSNSWILFNFSRRIVCMLQLRLSWLEATSPSCFHSRSIGRLAVQFDNVIACVHSIWICCALRIFRSYILFVHFRRMQNVCSLYIVILNCRFVALCTPVSTIWNKIDFFLIRGRCFADHLFRFGLLVFW